MYYSLKKNTVSLSLGFQISHLIPIRLPLSLSAIQKPQAFLPLDNHQVIASLDGISDMRWVRQRWWLWVEDDDVGWWPDWYYPYQIYLFVWYLCYCFI
ncbi:hypothetical protein HanXRQr2_Chr07g0288121 [Helianthus annuus]|uniref:Uncharacterized protein n=1 Tax=Helianthus annuus TaxID=4232 RepID=A0A251UA44_HELAN|nr:hypothetical protein HanXRQr2_Chr07g0288121 [Helianthus annuus]